MKNIIILLLSILLVSCSDSDNIYTPIDSLPIESSIVTFSANGGAGNIKLKTTQVSSAVSSEDWCSILSYSNGLIEFNVLPNNSLEERVSMISIKSDKSEGVISITQMGVVIDADPSVNFPFSSNTGFSKFIKFSSSSKVNVENSASDWLTHQIVDGGVQFTASENKTGKYRYANVKISSGQVVGQYQFIQFGINDVLGTWKMKALDDKANSVTDELNISQKTEDTLIINFTKLGYTNICATMKNNAITISCGQNIPSLMNPYIFYVGVYPSLTNGKELSPSVSYQLSPSVTSAGNLVFDFYDNGSLGAPITAFAIWAYDPSIKSIAGYWDLIFDINLSR
jgi:hypothetical protein